MPLRGRIRAADGPEDQVLVGDGTLDAYLIENIACTHNQLRVVDVKTCRVACDRGDSMPLFECLGEQGAPSRASCSKDNDPHGMCPSDSLTWQRLQRDVQTEQHKADQQQP